MEAEHEKRRTYAGRLIKWDADWPKEPDRAEWFKLTDIAIATVEDRQ